jgi:Mg2+-importing ATPase
MDKRTFEKESVLPFWSITPETLLQRLQTSAQGLPSDEAALRLQRYGPNLLKPRKRTDVLTLFLAQFKSPIILILIFAAVVSFALGDHSNPPIIIGIVIVSALLGFWQERGAARAVSKLFAMVRIKTIALRDGNSVEIPVEDVVPGDIIELRAGDVVPADGLILEAKDVFVDEAALTGETYPAEKSTLMLPEETVLGQRANSVFMGTHIISGMAKELVVETGTGTEFGKVSERLRLRPPETEFEHGIRRFGYLLIEITLMMVIFIFAVNVYLHRPVIQSFLFSAALAVGLTPQLLPAIISVNLSQGAKRMAEERVIVKRLNSIENFGSMDVLCADKTGTVTSGVMQVQSTPGADGTESEKVLLYAYLNACYQTGFANPIDEAIHSHRSFDISAYRKLDEVPYGFVRKRLSILVQKDGVNLMITKGAVSNILDICTLAEIDGRVIDMALVKDEIDKEYQRLGLEGFRVLAVAYRNIEDSTITQESEIGMVFLGFVVLFDPPKPGIAAVFEQLRGMGVSFKIITGDNRLVTANVCRQLGLSKPEMLTASDVGKMDDATLIKRVGEVDAFAEVEPNQKERIILALKKGGHVTGFIGDGINDASALHAADVSISVDTAVDVAKEAADIVLMEKDLAVLVDGIKRGRATFANTLKYVFMAASANFGNMFSMAGASLFLPFLPLLPVQILLLNILTDLPEMSIATDAVDPELVEKPRRWDIRFIRNFMLVFGSLSSVFDYITFGVLLLVLHAGMDQFRAGWFIESVISAAMVVLVIRTRRPFFRSFPGKALLWMTMVVVVIGFIFPYIPLGKLFSFLPLPVIFLPVVILIIILYVAAAEFTKKFFYRFTTLK